MSWLSRSPLAPRPGAGGRRPGMRRGADPVALALACAWLAAALWTRPGASGIAEAYIGPGAGIALFGSFLTVLVALLSGLAALVLWPVRLVWRLVRGRRAYARAKVRRVIIVGLDGLEPTLVEEYLAQGLLPNLARLREQGGYARLGTTWPPLSPVAWSSFSTGTNPGKHSIFDFLGRNPADYRPQISSVRIREPRRKLRLGPYVLPLSRPEITSLRKSKPFWSVLGEAGVFSAVLRVPITFPPDRFRGVQLSAMCVPDLRGSQGIFTYYTEQGRAGMTMDGDVGGDRILVQRTARGVESYVRGPANTLRVDRRELRAPFRVTANGAGGPVLHIGDERVPLRPGVHSPWVPVEFRAAPGVKVRGLCRFVLQRLEPFEMYCTPVQIDPRRPVMPISHPATYASYLACQQGRYATLGLAEDTWSLSERVLDEGQFLAQAYDIHAERERMLRDALQRVRHGLVVCVFDAPDRIQHMFWRFLDERHPALAPEQRSAHREAIRELYVRMDATVGRVLAELRDGDALLVMSDHGFKPFRRGVDLNAWLREGGYLKLRDGARAATRPYLADVDWSGTRAYALGLAGIFLNRRGREAQGTVAPGAEAAALLRELKDKLTGLRDPQTGEEAIHEAVLAREVYRGPYVERAPDLIIGYNAGYRVAWDAAVGKCGPAVFSDNRKAWSGDHCVHPALVPGVLFSNLKLAGAGANIVDLAPTVLDLFGVERPAYLDGKSLLCADTFSAA